MLVVAAACWSPIGAHYPDADAIAMSRTWKDWVVVGQFGPPGPFTLVDFKECEVNEPCTFSHNGLGHTYNKFNQFRLAVLRLEGPGGEISHVVLRSKEKIYDDA